MPQEKAVDDQHDEQRDEQDDQVEQCPVLVQRSGIDDSTSVPTIRIAAFAANTRQNNDIQRDPRS